MGFRHKMNIGQYLWPLRQPNKSIDYIDFLSECTAFPQPSIYRECPVNIKHIENENESISRNCAVQWNELWNRMYGIELSITHNCFTLRVYFHWMNGWQLESECFNFWNDAENAIADNLSIRYVFDWLNQWTWTVNTEHCEHVVCVWRVRATC